MAFRKRRSRNPSSSRASNKIRVTSNKRFAELESIVDFASENESDDIQFMNIPHLNHKEESKESYDIASDKLKKREIKLLNKGSFEEQLLSEFRRFADGMLSKMDEQNKLLREIAKTNKSNYTSFNAKPNLNIKYETYEKELANDHSDIVEHQIDNPELFHDPYPFEKFEESQLPNLAKESLKFYKEQLKFAENIKPLAYYFFEHRNLSKGVKSDIKTTYKQFISKYENFTVDNLKNYFTNLDITNSMTCSSLALDWKKMKRIGSCSFGINNKEFPTIKFSSNRQGREENISAINKDNFLKAAKQLYDTGDYEDALLIHIMWSLASRPNEMVTLRFEDFEDNNNQKSVLYYANKKNQRKRITIADDLYEQVIDFKNFKIENGRYHERSLTTSTGKTLTGHFVFDLTRSKLQKKFSRKFKKLIPGLKLRPKDIRMSSISNEMRDHGIYRASSLGMHSTIRTTREHYIREAQEFK